VNFFSKISLLFFLFLSTSYAEDTLNWNRETLSTWIGKYPTTMTMGKSTRILEQATIKKILRHILPASERKALGNYTVETPITQVENFLIIDNCKPHNCPNEFVMIVINLSTPHLWAGFFLREQGLTSTRWYSNADDYSTLPSAIKQKFLSRHEGELTHPRFH